MNHDQPVTHGQVKPKAIAVDLDGTLAEYHGWKGIEHIGEPVVPMVRRVQKWIQEGHRVVIYTARACEEKAKFPIQEWLLKIGLPILDITNTKRKEFSEFWDDRAVGIIPNTGMTLSEHLAQDKFAQEECAKALSETSKPVVVEVPTCNQPSYLEAQVGGDHYKRMKIQPVEYCHANGMGGIESAVVKYVSRHKFKNGKQDIDKAIHLLELLKELEY